MNNASPLDRYFIHHILVYNRLYSSYTEISELNCKYIFASFIFASSILQTFSCALRKKKTELLINFLYQ